MTAYFGKEWQPWKFEARLVLKPGAKPKFCRTRPVLNALYETIENELKCLESKGVVENISHSDWATPIVAVWKEDESVRFCGHYKVSVNPNLDIDQYPLPRPEDLMTCLSGTCWFKKAGLVVCIPTDGAKGRESALITMNTNRCLYRFTRLPFGIVLVAAIFQKTVDAILQGLPWVIGYLNDILVTGTTNDDHLQNLEEVLNGLHQYNVRLKRTKCQFVKETVVYLVPV